MAHKVILGAGSHEPIFHRIRTGHASASEWQRWERESISENFDVLQQVGVSRILVACTKGFGMEVEKPLIDRAARMREECDTRGMQCNIYVQGLPVYYETFLVERPEAEDWMARTQDGAFYPWGGQTFRRWMDPYSEEFLEYERGLIRHAVETVRPHTVFIDNTVSPGISYTHRSVEAFRAYLRDKYADQDPVRLFGIRSYDKVDLPRFDPVYWPADAYRIVKDPILQEVCHWRAHTYQWWCGQIRKVVKDARPEARYVIACGCDTLRTNALAVIGVDYHSAIRAADMTSQEESFWRPRVFLKQGASQHAVIRDGRDPDGVEVAPSASVRVSTDARWTKILGNHGRRTGFGFWGEFERVDQEIAAAHGMTFAADAFDFGTVGPLAGHPNMADTIKPMAAWAANHIDLLTGREERVSLAGVWRGTATNAFIRHTPIWACCSVEQMLFENHLPFTILLDEDLGKWLTGRRVLLLPMTSCVSDRQAKRIVEFVNQGGGLVLIGDAGTRDERTCVRERHAFAEVLPAAAIQQIERIGPPHFVPEVNMGGLREIIRSEYGKGRVALVPKMEPVRPLDLTRDPYSPHRKVAPEDILPPANEQEIWREILWTMNALALRVEGPRYTLCEFWRQGKDLLVCCANLHPQADGGPITLHFPGISNVPAEVFTLFEDSPREVTVRSGMLTIDSVPRLVFVRLDDIAHR